ncbi:MAG TPA: glycoside hydrolase family 3 C-terminal domain-containing protein [Terracidiphilus sp.]|jgi:beta-glucosidase
MKNQFSVQSICRCVVFCLCAILAGSCAWVAAQAPVAGTPEIEARTHAVLAKLTLEQKIELIGGVNDMYTHADPSVGLPRFKMSDASVGVRTWGPTTAYAGGVMLAATWDPDFARKLGESLGRDARARDVNFLLGPGVNIARSPVAGRNFEYLSEDPYLNSVLVAPYIQGVQSEGVIATVKHFALNNEEYSRHDTDVEVDERTMRELYLPAFEAAVKQGHVDAVMNSYNMINGQHATQNEFLNLKVLKGEWGFQGILMSDWDSTYDGVGAANNGLDFEMPSARFMNAKTLLPAIEAGTVKESAIDDKVLRIVRTALRYGFMDRPQFDPSVSTYSVAARAVALQGALEGITLLKNDGHLLPLDATKVKTIAVIGPDAWPAVVGGGGSSQASAFEPVSLVGGIANLVGPDVHVLYTRGLPEMMDVFGGTNWSGPVSVATYPSKDFTGSPTTDTQPKIADYKDEWWGPADKGPRTVRYTASYKADKAGKYLLVADDAGGDKYTISVDGKQMLEQTQAEGQVAETATLDLSAGQTVSVVVDYRPNFSGTRLGVGMMSEADMVSEEVKKYAAAADVVVVSVGFSPASEGEGADRTFTLPFGQDALLEAVTSANPHTIVVLTAGGAVDTHRWLNKVPALLDNFYPGQEGGTAIADVLFGKQNPEGRLPVSFDRSWEENPSYQYYYPIKGGDTVLHVPVSADQPPHDITIGHVKYGDKLMVGYRYWTTTGKHPLYPFGYGLSYTTFRMANLQAPKLTVIGTIEANGVQVSFDVTNTGSAAGADVAQVYVSDPSAKVQRPERELKGFEKVRLQPGETKHVSVTLDARAFSYWDESTHKWTIDPGKFVIRVGDSSENTPLSGDVTLK